MLMCVCHADNCRHSCALERVGVVAQNFGECVRGAALTMARERERVCECGRAGHADDARNNRFVPTLRLALSLSGRVAKFGTVINGRVGPRAPLVSADLEPR